MSKKLKVAELAVILSITPKTAYKVIEREGLITSKDIVNGREITVINIDESSLLELQEKYKENNGNNIVNNGNYEDILTAQYTIDSDKNIENKENLLDKFINYSIAVNKEHREELKTYIERVINAEKQVKLLEDSEHNKESEYLRQVAELKAENEKLKELLNKRVGFLGLFKR